MLSGGVSIVQEPEKSFQEDVTATKRVLSHSAEGEGFETTIHPATGCPGSGTSCGLGPPVAGVPAGVVRSIYPTQRRTGFPVLDETSLGVLIMRKSSN
jgi:hypothetical protein